MPVVGIAAGAVGKAGAVFRHTVIFVMNDMLLLLYFS